MSTSQGPVESGSGIARPRILLVEDHENGRRSLSRLLDAMGFEVVSTNDGQSALETLRSAPRFHYLLTDVRLPDLDGREVVIAARGMTPTPRIALITGWGPVEPEETERLGVDWVFLKPLDVPAIVARLRENPPRS